jgi:hypothetical protein
MGDPNYGRYAPRSTYYPPQPIRGPDQDAKRVLDEIRAREKAARKVKKIKFIESVAKWCDAGNHPFSSKDPDKKRWVEESESEGKDGDTLTTQEEYWMCGECRAKSGLFRQASKGASGGDTTVPESAAKLASPTS